MRRRGHEAGNAQQQQRSSSLTPTASGGRAARAPLPPLQTDLDTEEERLRSQLQGCDAQLQVLRASQQGLPLGAGAPSPGAAATPRAVPATPMDPSVVRRVVTATGQGCSDVIAASARAGGALASRPPVWTTR